MATRIARANVTNLAQELGARAPVFNADLMNESHEITIEAPRGKVWSASQTHELIARGENGEAWTRLYTDIHARMTLGVEDCPDGTTCEWCHAAYEIKESRS